MATFHRIRMFVLFSTLHSQGSATSLHSKHRTDDPIRQITTVRTVQLQCSKQREYMLLFGTNLCITSKLHLLCLKKVD